MFAFFSYEMHVIAEDQKRRNGSGLIPPTRDIKYIADSMHITVSLIFKLLLHIYSIYDKKI